MQSTPVSSSIKLFGMVVTVAGGGAGGEFIYFQF